MIRSASFRSCCWAKAQQQQGNTIRKHAKAFFTLDGRMATMPLFGKANLESGRNQARAA